MADGAKNPVTFRVSTRMFIRMIIATLFVTALPVWTIYDLLCLGGADLYATGGTPPMKRWQRYIIAWLAAFGAMYYLIPVIIGYLRGYSVEVSEKLVRSKSFELNINEISHITFEKIRVRLTIFTNSGDRYKISSALGYENLLSLKSKLEKLTYQSN